MDKLGFCGGGSNNNEEVKCAHTASGGAPHLDDAYRQHGEVCMERYDLHRKLFESALLKELLVISGIYK